MVKAAGIKEHRAMPPLAPTRPVVLVGSRTDEHVSQLARRIEALGGEPLVVDTLAFPGQTRLALTEGLDGITVNGQRLGTPGAVYLRSVYTHPLAFGVDVDEDMDADWRTTLVTFREKATLLRGLLGRWEAMGVPLYNPESTSWRIHKPLQLALLAQAGLPVPETLWTNDAEAVRRFAATRRVAYKPVNGGASTQALGPEDLSEERLAALDAAPVTFQALMPGEDVRVYVLDGEVIASIRILSKALDFRQNEERVESFALPPEVAAQCLRATQVLGLRWTGMDLKRDAGGTLRILELNESPMFLGFDARAGTDILGRLAQGLVQSARAARP
jgi:glutathione synthase/RimK-type ligase-like ATP-grasp enzyme